MIQFKGCHPVNPLTGDIVRDLLVWFEELPDGSLHPTPIADGPFRNCSALPNRARAVRCERPDIGADVPGAILPGGSGETYQGSERPQSSSPAVVAHESCVGRYLFGVPNPQERESPRRA
mgnify:CR=1 FL=1